MSYITSAIGGISDEHIAEFAFVKPKKIYTGVLMKIAAAAACAAVVVTGVPKIKGVIYSTNSSDILNSVADNPLETDFPFESEYDVKPSYVIFNGEKYTLRISNRELPGEFEKYKVVGEILSVDPSDRDKEGFSDCCAVGDLIFQDPEVDNIIYVCSSVPENVKKPHYWMFANCTFEGEDVRNVEELYGGSTIHDYLFTKKQTNLY